MSSPTTPRNALDGLEWIRRANDRDIGAGELREVDMQIADGGRVLRTLRITTVRETDGDRSRTLFCLTDPAPLSNINYVLTERRGDPGSLAVSLHLPYGAGTFLDLAVTQQRQGVLGSTFTYEDLRTWLYERGQECGPAIVDGPAVRVRCRDGERACEVLLDPGDGFVLGVDHLPAGPAGGAPERRYRATEIRTVDGVRVAGVMTMRRGDRCTTIHLRRARYGPAFDPRLFELEWRRNCRQRLGEW
ncbi:hypothetical protein ACPCHT_09180 [Nucisporomicrobium flavum]|uniref:hypothetical protein n=1 Tax=Nucisporomicrobium flavum TaxID=2785915 RepID=UPI0018F36CFC|nr:hypothetical protein [Nucisporomicrobium flavum]